MYGLGKKTNRTSCIQTMYPKHLPKAPQKVSKGLKMTAKMNPQWYFGHPRHTLDPTQEPRQQSSSKMMPQEAPKRPIWDYKSSLGNPKKREIFQKVWHWKGYCEILQKSTETRPPNTSKTMVSSRRNACFSKGTMSRKRQEFDLKMTLKWTHIGPERRFRATKSGSKSVSF